jgi:hypothetical protein
MDIFHLRDHLIHDYAEYANSLSQILEANIQGTVQESRAKVLSGRIPSSTTQPKLQARRNDT